MSIAVGITTPEFVLIFFAKTMMATRPTAARKANGNGRQR